MFWVKLYFFFKVIGILAAIGGVLFWVILFLWANRMNWKDIDVDGQTYQYDVWYVHSAYTYQFRVKKVGSGTIISDGMPCDEQRRTPDVAAKIQSV